jgi:hypothetical protein
MRALGSTLAFLVAAAAVAGSAQAHLPLFTPRVALSLAIDWNKMALQALQHPAPPAETTVARHHQAPRLGVAGPVVAAPPPIDRAAVSKVELYTRVVVTPSYTAPTAVQETRLFRAAYMMPYAPYLGCYGVMLTVQSDALLR